MLDKLRRKSKDFATKSLKSQGPHSSPSSRPKAPSTSEITTFFDLPAELRVHIYELVASDTNLSVLDTRSGLRTPSLLFVTHRVRAEYRPILLSNAPIRAHVTDYHFRPLIRLIGSLYSSELKALRNNPNLKIELHVKHHKGFDKESMPSLRQWAVKRAQYLDRLQWTYELSMSTPARMSLQVATATFERCMNSLQAVSNLERSVHESLAAEMQPILAILFVHTLQWRNDLAAAESNGLRSDDKLVSLSSISGSKCLALMQEHRQARQTAPTPV